MAHDPTQHVLAMPVDQTYWPDGTPRREPIKTDLQRRLDAAFVEGFRKGATAPEGQKAIARLAFRRQPGA